MPPGYGQPPPFGQPTPPKNNNGWLIGGVAAGLILLLAIGVVIVVIASSSSDDGSNNAGDDTSTSDSDSGSDPTEDADSGDQPSGDSGNGEYAPQAGICGQINMDKFTEQERGFGSFEETAYSSNITCDASATYGSIYVSIDTYSDPASAADRFTSTSDIWLSDKKNLSEVDGPWDQSSIGEGDVSGSDISLTMVVQAGNMVVLINFYNYGDDGSQSGGVDAAVDGMKQIVELAAA